MLKQTSNLNQRIALHCIDMIRNYLTSIIASIFRGKQSLVHQFFCNYKKVNHQKLNFILLNFDLAFIFINNNVLFYTIFLKKQKQL